MVKTPCAASALQGWAAPAPRRVRFGTGFVLLALSVRLHKTAWSSVQDRTAPRARACRQWQNRFWLLAVVGLTAIGAVVALSNVTHYRALIVALTLRVAPPTVILAGRSINLWWVVAGFGATLILWGSGVVSWLRRRTLRRRAPAD